MSSTGAPNTAKEPAKERLLHHDDSFDTINTAKPRLAVGEQEVEKRDPSGLLVPEQPSRFYWVRPLVLVFIPSIVTAYFGIIWVHLLQNSTFDETVKCRSFSGSLIFYSWFIIGVFGLSWSKFGLAGVEASMLRTRFWGAPSLLALLMHSNETWSSPSGWIHAITHREFHRLWCLLAFLSLLPTIALPLSGLVFEITDGYIEIADPPFVVGPNPDTFNSRVLGGETEAEDEDEDTALLQWRIASIPTIPRFGVIFTGESVDRTKYFAFKGLPNSLPLNESIPDLFLAPQAEKPVSGTTWGLRFKYDCSIVRSASEFTILNQKSASSITDAEFGLKELQTPSGDSIHIHHTSRTLKGGNTQAYLEIGTSAEPRTVADDGHFPLKYSGVHPGFETDEVGSSLVFEYALWQFRHDSLYDDNELDFDTTVEHSIQGIGSPIFETEEGWFAINNTFFTIDGVKEADMTEAIDGMELPRFINGSSDGDMLFAAPPIGVRCVASSDVGTARLDGVTSTFRNFQRSPPRFNILETWHATHRFGLTAQGILFKRYREHYLSGNLPGAIPGRSEQQTRFEGFVTSGALLRSTNLAYALDAWNLMYRTSAVFNKEWLETGLRSSRDGRILSVASLIPSSAVGYFVLGLFCVWAALSAALGLWYGFRRRPADRLDGYTMLRKGVDMSAELKENDEFMSGKSYGDSGTLAALSGDVFDRRR